MRGSPRRPRARSLQQPARTALTDCQLHRLRVHRRVVSKGIAAHYTSSTRCRLTPRSIRSVVANLHCSHTRVLLQTARSRRASAKRRPYRASRRRRAVVVDGVPWRLDVRESIASTAWRWGRTAIHGVHRRDSSLAGQEPRARRQSKKPSKDAPQARRAPPRRAKQRTNQILRCSLLDGVKAELRNQRVDGVVAAVDALVTPSVDGVEEPP